MNRNPFLNNFFCLVYYFGLLFVFLNDFSCVSRFVLRFFYFDFDVYYVCVWLNNGTEDNWSQFLCCAWGKGDYSNSNRYTHQLNFIHSLARSFASFSCMCIEIYRYSFHMYTYNLKWTPYKYRERHDTYTHGIRDIERERKREWEQRGNHTAHTNISTSHWYEHD